MIARQLNDRIKYFEEIASKYGHEDVSPSRVYEVATEVIQAEQMRLCEARRRYYAARSNDDIVQVVKLYPTKGASCYVQWGLSLGYMPDKWRPGLRRHRTLKSVRLELWENAFEYLNLDAERRVIGGAYAVKPTCGRRPTRTLDVKKTFRRSHRNSRALVSVWR